MSADTSNAEWQRDLSYSLTLLAESYHAHGERSSALEFAVRSLAIDERLAKLDPTNVTWQRDVEVSRALLARLQAQS
ncbi:hypothetical protein [Aquabacterium sp. J223]|uniref:hypothetical protein n=1 Tax=Aquabacterium sp. J223 TaxID=2898431 RepID=UPI0021AE0ABE|nr:hypothetical protein [Aquabacterium sp. J223]UUX95406.1 hypothetical protein LRS07_19690 [Aquabacterium sp. J223]